MSRLGLVVRVLFTLYAIAVLVLLVLRTPAPFDRLEGCGPPDGVGKDNEGGYFLVRRCPDGLAVMVPILLDDDDTPEIPL